MNLTVISNSAGITIDPFLSADLQALLDRALGIDTVYISVHGWLTDLSDFSINQNRFLAGLYPRIISACHSGSRGLTIGLHWPSSLSQDGSNPLNFFDALTYYSCEHRADTVGANAGFALLASIIRFAGRPIRFVLIAHSFGCKVVSSALNALAKSDTIIPPGTVFDAILLQGAFENNDLELGEDYGLLQSIPTRIVATYSPYDKALNNLFRQAAIVNIFKPNHNRDALGGRGPTQLTLDQWGGRLVAINLSPWQTPIDSTAGNHSDVYLDPLYARLAELLATSENHFPYRSNSNA